MYKPAFNPASRLFAVLALFMALATPSLAQDRYRAEIVILERLADPILQEQMTSKRPGRVEADKRLLVVDANGNRQSDVSLSSDLTLNQAASRLENSGKYRVLMKAGWSQQFPPNHKGEPLAVEIGDYLEASGHRAVEGTIEINRRRYLLVNVALNHWREASGDTRRGDDDRRDASDVYADSNDDERGSIVQESDLPMAGRVGSGNPDRELVTWIRETRRMRSKEIHFVDSPTIGVLIYFRPLD